MKIQILILFPLFSLKRFLMMIYQKLKDLLEIPNSCLLQKKTGIQNLLLLICSLKKELFKHSFLFLFISFMNEILMVCLNKKSLIKWVICLWLVLLIKITMILINLKLLIYLLLVFLILFVDGGIHISWCEADLFRFKCVAKTALRLQEVHFYNQFCQNGSYVYGQNCLCQ